MCGRYELHENILQLELPFALDWAEWENEQQPKLPNYNVAPTQEMPVILWEDGRAKVRAMRWGLVPFWAKDIKIGYKLINARAETLREKPSFRNSFHKGRRCIIPSNGFYEWKREGKTKTPYRITTSDGWLLFAGLHEYWEMGGNALETFTIVTGAPNELVAPIHNRMPVILRSEHLGVWIHGNVDDEDYASLTEPFPAGAMHCHPVTTEVNSPKNNHEELLEPT